MNLAVVATVFAIIAVAELPDKTMIAMLVMGSRGRPFPLWIGAVAAFAVHCTIAVLAGRILLLLPHRWVEGIVTLLFAAGAAYLLFVPEKAEEEKGQRQAREADGWHRVALGAFAVILVGEFGDLTQILVMNLAARYRELWSVFAGGLGALATVAAVGAWGGQALRRVLPVRVIRRCGGIVLVGFTAYDIVGLVRS